MDICWISSSTIAHRITEIIKCFTSWFTFVFRLQSIYESPKIRTIHLILWARSKDIQGQIVTIWMVVSCRYFWIYPSISCSLLTCYCFCLPIRRKARYKKQWKRRKSHINWVKTDWNPNIPNCVVPKWNISSKSMHGWVKHLVREEIRISNNFDILYIICVDRLKNRLSEHTFIHMIHLCVRWKPNSCFPPFSYVTHNFDDEMGIRLWCLHAFKTKTKAPNRTPLALTPI